MATTDKLKSRLIDKILSIKNRRFLEALDRSRASKKRLFLIDRILSISLLFNLSVVAILFKLNVLQIYKINHTSTQNRG